MWRWPVMACAWAGAWICTQGTVGCASQHAALDGPAVAEVGAQTSSALVSPQRPWRDLSVAQRKQHMVEHVLPVMAPLLQAYDGQRFEVVRCSTCHGPKARQRDYAMPSDALPVLYPSGSKEQKQTVQAHRAMATFMFQQVTPTMRELLGLAPFDAGSGQGFSCFYCHPRGEPKTGGPLATIPIPGARCTAHCYGHPEA